MARFPTVSTHWVDGTDGDGPLEGGLWLGGAEAAVPTFGGTKGGPKTAWTSAAVYVGFGLVGVLDIPGTDGVLEVLEVDVGWFHKDILLLFWGRFLEGPA